MTKPMDVCFDLDALSKVFLAQDNFRGISRVTFELARSLAAGKYSGLRLAFGSSRYPQLGRYMELEMANRGVRANRFESGQAIHRVCDFLSGELRPRYTGSVIGRFLPPVYDGGSDFDIVHSPYLPIRTTKDCKAVKVNTVHDIIAITNPEFFTSQHAKRVQNDLDRVAATADHFVCVSAYTRKQFCDHYGIPGDRTSVIPLSASQDTFFSEVTREEIGVVRRRYGIPPCRYVLSLATVEPRKNFRQVLRSFGRIKGVVDDELALVVAGREGWLQEQLREWTKDEQRLLEGVYFVGAAEDQDLAALYAGAEVFVFLSLLEGFGLPPLEAMQCGTPVVCSNRSSLPEVVGEAACLVDPENLEMVSSAIVEILRSTTLQDSMRLRGLTRASTFSWRKTADQHVDLYRSLV